MRLIQCVNAYTAIVALSEKECDYRTAHVLVMLKRRLQPHVDFFAKEEMELVEQFAVKDDNGKIVMNEHRNFTFADPARSGEYAKLRSDLGMIDIQEQFTPLRAPMPSSIRPVHLEALEGFIEFEDGGDGE